jgi:hypothetical protein
MCGYFIFIFCNTLSAMLPNRPWFPTRKRVAPSSTIIFSTASSSFSYTLEGAFLCLKKQQVILLLLKTLAKCFCAGTAFLEERNYNKDEQSDHYKGSGDDAH